VHARRSGVADYYATSDEHALALARGIVRNLTCADPTRPGNRAGRTPALDPNELYGLIPEDFRQQTDARELIAGSSTVPLPRVQGVYGETLVAGFARIEGISRILANNGVLFAIRPERRHFIELCCSDGAARLPAEHHRLHGRSGVRGRRHRRDGAKLVMAVANAQVPKFTVITGARSERGTTRLRARVRPRSSGCGRTPASL